MKTTMILKCDSGAEATCSQCRFCFWELLDKKSTGHDKANCTWIQKFYGEK